MTQRLFGLNKRLTNGLLVVFVFVTALWPRLGEAASRPNVWYERSYAFSLAVLEQDWAGTYQRYHPGVTFMWLASVGIQWHMRQHGFLTQEQVLLHEPVAPGAVTDLVGAALFPITLTISAAIALLFWWLKSFIGPKIALAASLLVALDPLHLMYSKVAHLDALLSVLMLLSALALIRFVIGHGRFYLFASGLLAGLALLTKTSAVFLIPYTALILGWPSVWSLLQRRGTDNWQNWRGQIGRAAGDFALWLVVTVIIMFSLFPALWVNAGTVLAEMYGNLIRHASNTHKNPVFFAGQNWIDQDPGFAFYAAIIAYKTTAVTLIFALVGLIMGLRRPLNQTTKVLWAFAAFAFFFYVQMSIGDFKQMSYVLPALPALDIVAGIGLVLGWQYLASYLRWSTKAAVPVGLGVLLLLHAVLILSTYPQFGTYHNQLLGGTRAAAKWIPLQEEAEGIDKALDFIEGLNYSEAAPIAIAQRLFSFAPRWHTGCYRTEDPTWAAFRVYDLNSMMRGTYNDVWLHQWEADQQLEPLFTITYDGVTYAWVYGDMPEIPTATSESIYQFGEKIRLVSAQISETNLQPGDDFDVVLQWVAADWICEDYKTFVHVYGADGSLVAQSDVWPLDGKRPTGTWTPGETIEDVIIITLPPDLMPDSYVVATGMYDAVSLQRLPVSGSELDGPKDTAVLTEITVGE